MSSIQLFFLVFIFFAASRAVYRLLKKETTLGRSALWLAFWFIVALAVSAPQTTDIVAQTVGVSRGADLLVYISVLVLFYAVFKIIARLERIDRQLTIIAREMALSRQDK